MKHLLQSALIGFLYAALGLAAQLLRLCGWRRELIGANLDRCLPELDAARRGEVQAGVYSHLGQLMAEFLAQGFMGREELAQRVHFVNPEVVRDRLGDPKGRVLILSSHHSNWEWLLQRCATEFGEPLTAAYKHTRRKRVDRLLRWWRERLGCRMVKAKALVAHLLEQRGKVRLLAMLADQSPSIRNDKHAWVEFFGQQTAFFEGPGWIGAKLGYSVFLATMHRKQRGHYVVRFIELVPAGSRAEPEQILSAYCAALERHIRQYPAEYFWAYHRWKREKPLYA